MKLAFHKLKRGKAICGEKGRKDAKGKHLQVPEWPVILQGWRWAGEEVDGRERLAP